MRMWMLPPRMLCRNHLLGEHNEIHKHRHNFVKKHKLDGRFRDGDIQIEPLAMKKRHDELAKEMIRRGYVHASPYEMPDLGHLPPIQRYAKVDRLRSAELLRARCVDCKV